MPPLAAGVRNPAMAASFTKVRAGGEAAKDGAVFAPGTSTVSDDAPRTRSRVPPPAVAMVAESRLSVYVAVWSLAGVAPTIFTFASMRVVPGRARPRQCGAPDTSAWFDASVALKSTRHGAVPCARWVGDDDRGSTAVTWTRILSPPLSCKPGQTVSRSPSRYTPPDPGSRPTTDSETVTGASFGTPKASAEGGLSTPPVRVESTRTAYRVPAARPVMVWLAAGAPPGTAGATTACRAAAYSCAPDLHCTL